MSNSWLAHMDAVPPVKLGGGKALGLFRLLSLGLAVPRFVVLTTEAYRAACRDGQAPQVLPPEVELVLDTAWAEMGRGAAALAVRSSAADEDGAERSYAGQMETFLNVTSRAGLSAAVLGCWRSLGGARALAYRAARPGSQRGTELAMAVVIQEMLAPDSAGVVFTVNPVSGRNDELLVNSVWGLGEGLVSGVLDADTFVVGRADGIKSRSLAHKAEKVVALAGGGTKRVSVPPADAGTPSLDDRTLHELCRAALKAEKLAGCPLDIEFAVADRHIYFLQARPVTAFNAAQAVALAQRQVWDNSNINESYPGITLPLTYSFIRRAYRAVYWQFCQVLGLSEKDIQGHDGMLSNMLGLLNGRVYYNLLNWYRLVALLPGFQFNKSFMEGMMGLRQPADLQGPRQASWTQKYLCELPRLLRTGWRAVWLQWTLERRIRGFHRDFDCAHKHFSTLNYETMKPAEVLGQYHGIEQAILWRWKAPIINDFSAMIFYGVLKKLAVSWSVDPDGSLQNALISRQGQIESTRVAEDLWGIATLISGDEALKQRFLDASPAEALQVLRSNREVRDGLERYLARFGDRCIAELKLESRTLRDDPAFCVAVLANYLRGSGVRFENPSESISPQAARVELASRLRGRFTRFGLPKLWAYRWVLKRAAAAIRNRENQRLARTRAFAVVRRMFRSVGESFLRGGLLDSAADIFYLKLEELEAVADGSGPGLDLRALVKERRALYERFKALPALPEHLETPGPVAENEVVNAAAPPLSPPCQGGERGGTGVLRGLGACPGVLERPAMVLLEPDTSLRLAGEILVTRQTDPGWVVLFPSISGLVTERGSMLSHSAIVAREMGIPAVVGVPGATQRIHTGDLLRLDGARGTVEILLASDPPLPPFFKGGKGGSGAESR